MFRCKHPKHPCNGDDLIPWEDAAIPVNDVVFERNPSMATITKYLLLNLFLSYIEGGTGAY